jgi:hypothetical protein
LTIGRSAEFAQAPDPAGIGEGLRHQCVLDIAFLKRRLQRFHQPGALGLDDHGKGGHLGEQARAAAEDEEIAPHHLEGRDHQIAPRAFQKADHRIEIV